MTPRTAARRRAAFTLVELLVVMALLIALAALALLVVPKAMDQDRTVDGAGTVQQVLAIAKARAARDGLPRGVRFLSAPAGNNVLATEFQYVEAPPVILPPPGSFAQITYAVTPGPNPPAGQIQGRQVQLVGLQPDQEGQLGQGAFVYLPVPGVFLPALGNPFAVTDPQSVAALDGWMGGATSARAAEFGIYPPARPLLGEPPTPLPANICVDLSPAVPGVSAAPSNPAYTLPLPAVLPDYDVIFAPSGTVTRAGPTGSPPGEIMLWVRDSTKVATPLVIAGGGYDSAPFENGGEQMIVSLKARSGALGVFPVAWPPLHPYEFARRGATNP